MIAAVFAVVTSFVLTPLVVATVTSRRSTFKGLTLAQLRQLAPNLKEARAVELLPYLNAAMLEATLTTARRAAAFLGQLLLESGELRYFEELATGEAYEGREDLGNTHEGDGRRYKGRGPIQLTGRANYRKAGQALGEDLENHPERAALPEVGFRVAGWYWASRDLNSPADRGDIEAVTRAVNGGLNGYAQRLKYTSQAMELLK